MSERGSECNRDITVSFRWDHVLSGRMRYQTYVESLKAYPHDMVVVHVSSLWRMRLRHKSTIPTCYSLGNVAVGQEDSYD